MGTPQPPRFHFRCSGRQSCSSSSSDGQPGEGGSFLRPCREPGRAGRGGSPPWMAGQGTAVRGSAPGPRGLLLLQTHLCLSRLRVCFSFLFNLLVRII